MTPKTNRLLMLLIGVAIAGCTNQTQRTSSGPGETQYERVGGSSNAVTQEELQRRAAAAEQAKAAPAEPPPAPVRPQQAAAETPPPKPAPVASTAAKDEAPAEFPITNEGPGAAASEETAKDEEVEDLGPQADESVSEPQEALAAADSSVGETTTNDDADESAEEVEDLGPQADDSVSEPQEALAAAESSVGETTMNDDDVDADESAEVEDLGPQADESVSEAQEEAAPAESSVGETTTYADDDGKNDAAEASAEVEDLGPQADESVSAPQGPATPPEKTVSEPTVFPDEPVEVAQTKPAPTPPPARTVTVNFETEPLFNFDKSEVRGDQRSKLDEFISSLSGTQYDSISVAGHTDRIGKDAYNQKLSERRAQAVKEYLVSKGVPAGKIQDEGKGKADPVSGDACNKVRARKKLIACLQPDRRVEVSVTATKK
jgi:OmpA-OmpF porin, OOP family